MSLIIVESPTKARTFNRILKGPSFAKASEGKQDYYVFATMGHIRDLPGKEMAIGFENEFEPKYEIIERKAKTVQQLIELASKHNEIILATDMDR
ncbi:MAG: toprim domain-containing protein, partial [Patescibacteria group bacterium]